MPYIYKITNKINGKSYIGKTVRSIDERWHEHLREANQTRSQHRPLYKAFNKYGIDNFTCELIEEVSLEQVDARERYWIEYYKTFKIGYNITIGGDGKPYIDYDLVYATYKELKTCSAVAEKLHIDPGTVSYIVKACGGQVIPQGRDNLLAPKIVNMYDLNGNYLQTFPSCSAAVKWCVENNFCKKESSGARGHICNCANGKEKTAFKHIWRYAD